MEFNDLIGSSYKGDNETLKRLYKMNAQHFDRIVNHIKNKNISPFFGAGFSGAAYPSWTNLFKEMAKPFPNCRDEINKLLKNGEFEEAASLLCEEMGEYDFLNELYEIFGKHTLAESMKKISDTRKAIPKLFSCPLITTNVDQVLEEIYNFRLSVITPHTDYHVPHTERSLQNSDLVLFKLHGDIEDKDHIIFTKEAYDNVYGSEYENSTLKNTLIQIFNSKIILFIGCSLETDRVLKVLESCCKNHDYYAVVELPEETKNEINPFEPLLLSPDGSENEAYSKRRKFMSAHHINCIWYPYRQFEALDLILDELQNRINPQPPVSPKASSIPSPKREIIGRTSEIENIYRSCLNDTKPIFVSGTAGIGKTEVCNLVLKKLERDKYDIVYVSAAGIGLPVELCKSITQALNTAPLPDEKAVNLINYLEYLNQNMIGTNKVLYIDNFEDVWYSIKSVSLRIELLEWMHNLSVNHIPVLVSSQIFPEEYDVPVLKYKMPILDRSSGEDRKLFEQVYRSKDGHLPLEGNLFEDLINQLDGHPLSIILTATQAANAASWNTVLERWEQAHQKTRNSRHNSLDAALMMSWNGVRDDEPFCTEIWGLSALCREELNYSDLMELSYNYDEKEKFNTAIGKLRNASLIDWTENGTALKMLQPVKKAFFLLADESEKISCIKRWYD